jgi:hypothetical protein
MSANETRRMPRDERLEPWRVIPLARTLSSLHRIRESTSFLFLAGLLTACRVLMKMMVESSFVSSTSDLLVDCDSDEHVILDGQMEGRHSPVLSRRRPRISP